jgi:hypothetical protein
MKIKETFDPFELRKSGITMKKPKIIINAAKTRAE